MDKKIEELLPFYALDALSDEERALVDAYLDEHPEARQELEGLETAAAALPYGVPPVEPSSRAKETLMARVAEDQRASSSERPQISGPRPTRFARFLSAFSLGAALVAIAWVIWLNVQVSLLRSEIAALNDALVAQSNALEQINAKLPQATPSDVITVSLRGTDVQPQAQGQLIADPNSNSAVLVITGLAPLGSGKTYQVWLIREGVPVSAGLLTVDPNGQAVLIVNSKESISSFNSLGISIEPEGGSPQPTGEIVVLSDL